MVMRKLRMFIQKKSLSKGIRMSVPTALGVLQLDSCLTFATSMSFSHLLHNQAAATADLFPETAHSQSSEQAASLQSGAALGNSEKPRPHQLLGLRFHNPDLARPTPRLPECKQGKSRAHGLGQGQIRQSSLHFIHTLSGRVKYSLSHQSLHRQSLYLLSGPLQKKEIAASWYKLLALPLNSPTSSAKTIKTLKSFLEEEDI